MNIAPFRANGAPEAGTLQLDITYALASMRTGSLLDAEGAGEAQEQLEGLAATLPDLFGTVDTGSLDRISERLGGDGETENFAEILLISPEHTHVIQPLVARPGVALLAVSRGTSSIGLVLSAVRARLDVLESG